MARKIRSTKALGNSLASDFAKLQTKGVEFSPLISSLVSYRDSDGITNDDIFSPITEESVENLRLQIEKLGYNVPINVWELENGKYMIFSGHRRVKAMQLLGEKTIPARKYDLPESEAQRRRYFLGANIGSRGVNEPGKDIYAAKQIRYLEKIMCDLEGFQGSGRALDEELAREFGKSRSMIYRYKQLLLLSEKMQKAEEEGLLTIKAASSFAVLPHETQDKIADALLQLKETGKTIRAEEIGALSKELKALQNSREYDQVLLDLRMSELVSSFFRDQKEKAQPKKRNPLSKKGQKESDSYIVKFQARVRDFSAYLDKEELEEEDKKRIVEELQSLIEKLQEGV